MDRKYKRAREELGIPLHEVLDRINKDLAETNTRMTTTCLFRIEEDIRKRRDVKSAVALKYYNRIYEHWERQQKLKAIDEKYGG